MCTDLDFDKTTTLNGYEIRLNALEIEPFLKINLDAPDEEKFTGENSEIIKILLLKLQASLSITIHNGTINDLGHVGPNGTLVGMLTDLSDGKIDIGMNSRALFMLWKVRYRLGYSLFCTNRFIDENGPHFADRQTYEFLTSSTLAPFQIHVSPHDIGTVRNNATERGEIRVRQARDFHVGAGDCGNTRGVHAYLCDPREETGLR